MFTQMVHTLNVTSSLNSSFSKERLLNANIYSFKNAILISKQDGKQRRKLKQEMSLPFSRYASYKKTTRKVRFGNS